MVEPKYEQTYRLHSLKTDPKPFEAVLIGLKKYEIRFDNRGFEIGHELCLMETKYTGEEMKAGKDLVLTNRVVNKYIAHILRGPIYGLKNGWVILSFV